MAGKSGEIFPPSVASRYNVPYAFPTPANFGVSCLGIAGDIRKNMRKKVLLTTEFNTIEKKARNGEGSK